jgi:hypothetical protein
MEGVFRVGRGAAAVDQLGAGQLRQSVLESCGRIEAAAEISSRENWRPKAAPICATSRTGASRSSLANNEACKLAGIAKGARGAAATTALVSFSTNKRNPSLRSMI